MRLKRVEIIGFKSFADKSALDFSNGITCIVGPNGCGKSNISDAFRWVLGEQSAKSIRGNKMQDVIFAGTTQRKPLNFAEVTLYLDEINGALPVDYEEIAITRRLHRSGESEYFINKQPVRLKDLQSLFYDSGIGKSAFSIFEQGKIDQMINLSPLERRYIFEEAAGIVRFLQRKREALKKLEQVDLNISRVSDIHQEIEKQITVLEEQAEKARIYKEKKSQLGTLEKGILVAKWELLDKKITEASQDEEEQQNKLKESNKNLELLTQQLKALKDSLDEAEIKLQSKNQEVFKAQSRKEIKTKEQETNQERLKELLEREKKLSQDIASLSDTKKHRDQEKEKALKQQSLIEKEKVAAESAVNEQKAVVQTLETTVAKGRDELKRNQQEKFKIVQEESQVDNDLKQNKIRLENAQERTSQLKNRSGTLAAQTEELMNQSADKQRQLRDISNNVDELKHQQQTLEKQLKEATGAIQKKQAEQATHQQEMTEQKARQKVLVRLREEMEGFSSGSKRLLQEASTEKSALYKKLQGLYEYMASESGNEKELAIALKPYAQTLVVKTSSDFHLVLEFAKQNKLKDYSLFCLDNIPAQAEKGVGTLLSKENDNRVARNFLQNVILSSDLEKSLQQVKKSSGTEVIMHDGAFIDGKGVYFYAAQSENNIFVREAELKTVEKKLKELEKERQHLEIAMKELLEKKSTLQSEHSRVDLEHRRTEMKLVEVNFGLQRVNGDLEKARHETKTIESDLNSLSTSIENFNKNITQLTQKQAAIKERALNTNQSSTSLESELGKNVEKLGALQRDLKEKESAFQKIVTESLRLAHTLHLLEVKEQEAQIQQKRMEDEIAVGQVTLKKIKTQSSTFDTDMASVEAALEETSKASEQLKRDVTNKKKSIEELDKKQQDAREKLKKLETSLYQLENQKTHALTSQQNIVNDLLERYKLNIADARRLYSPLEKSLDATERLVRTLRQEIEEAGDINMTSIEECDKHKIRHEFLTRQMGDLDVSKQELVEIITQLDKESRKIFKETFEKIRQNFQKNFKILFNGGEADLQFTETQDILEAGIEIVVQPPGKQMRSINLLSGGEKCMTAMALLFAIFEVKPAPFCILDEIDAPLDDSNVKRFSSVVKQFVDRCQFIIITHNKCTMAIADVLFGVSMEEKGVSKLLSMEFSPNEKSPQVALV